MNVASPWQTAHVAIGSDSVAARRGAQARASLPDQDRMPPRMKTIDIAVPVFNEADGVEQFHRVLLAELARLADRYRFQIIYVLDRSSDGTLEILQRLADGCPEMRVLHLSRRFGHQMSLVAGMDHSSGDALIMMDADLQHPPAVIPELLARFEGGFDVVQTVRRCSSDRGRCT